ncbi:S8 family serine peptidase [Phenylobacterium sp.]|uniref:S8 family serine peptidase n=1 Tax=Phenylobacterium sp. TaxID=1871053 RepID=UPI002B9D382B|nr:S8 family serine peptidase [Phenylobacterium sp.]HLZ77580.1 S8 family serine peptidase [Phenylobacterium sp.]
MTPAVQPHDRHRRLAASALITCAILVGGSPAAAQILRGGLGLPGAPIGLPNLPPSSLPARVTDSVAGGANALTDRAVSELMGARAQAAQRLIREHRDVVEADDHGQPVVRGEALGLGVSDAALAHLREAGFTVRSAGEIAGLDLQAVVLGPPRGMSAVEALRRLRTLDPAGQYEFNHLYQPAGAVGAAASGAVGEGPGALERSVGVIDGAVAASAPTLSNARLVQQAFAPGGAHVTAHATAVASLIAGQAPGFRGAAAGATLYVADVYGPTAAGGSAEAVARAMGWLAQMRAPVISISLVGPPNRLLQAAVQSLIVRGYLVVAPVGNDGPAAPPLYPAAYPGVIAVTGVGPDGRLLPEAGRGLHVDFAAPGAGIVAAAPGGGVTAVRGTSFAAPIVAGALAGRMTGPDRVQAEAAVSALAREARAPARLARAADLGHGLIGMNVPAPTSSRAEKLKPAG